MLPSARRVPRSLFKPILKEGRYFNTRHFSLKFVLGEEEQARIAVSVSKKIAKKAVVRNRIRRRVYSTLNELLPGIVPGLYLVVAKVGAENIRGDELKRELKELFKV